MHASAITSGRAGGSRSACSLLSLILLLCNPHLRVSMSVDDVSPAAAAAESPALKLRLLQFNTLGKHLAETLQFPYAIDVEREVAVESRSANYESWDSYGVLEGHWLRKGLPEGSTPSEYLLGSYEKGTFGVEESSGKFIYDWKERLPQLVSQIQGQRPDLVFLQEIELGTIAQFASQLGARIETLQAPETPTAPEDRDQPPVYEGIHVPRDGNATSDGVALIWRAEILEALPDAETEVLRYSDGAQKMALLQQLRVKQTGSAFLAVTTHLHWNPAAPLQTGEVAELVERLDGMRRWPVILGGDLNCGIANAAYAQLPAAGFVDVDDQLPPAHQKRFTMHVPRAPVPKLTDARRWEDSAWTELNPVISDYILVRGAALSAVEALDTGTQGFSPSASNGLPNKAWSASDHFPIAYEIELRLLWSS